MSPEVRANIDRSLQSGNRVIGKNVEVLVDKIQSVKIKEISQNKKIRRAVAVVAGGAAVVVIAREGIRRFKHRKDTQISESNVVDIGKPYDRPTIAEGTLALPAPTTTEDTNPLLLNPPKTEPEPVPEPAEDPNESDYRDPPIIDKEILDGIRNLKKSGDPLAEPDTERKLLGFLQNEGAENIDELLPAQRWGKALEIVQDKFQEYASKVLEIASLRAKEASGLDDEPGIGVPRDDSYGVPGRTGELMALLNDQGNYEPDKFKEEVGAKLGQIEDAHIREYAMKHIAKEFGLNWHQVFGDLRPTSLIIKEGFLDDLDDTKDEASRFLNEVYTPVNNNFRSRVDFIKNISAANKEGKEPGEPDLAKFKDLDDLLTSIKKAKIDDEDPLVKVERKLRDAGKLKANEIIEGKSKKPKKTSKDKTRERRTVVKRNTGLIALGVLGVTAFVAAVALSKCDEKDSGERTPVSGVAATRTAEAQATPTVTAIGEDIAETSGELSQQDAKDILDWADGDTDGNITFYKGEDNFHTSIEKTLGELGANSSDVDRFQSYLTEEKYNFDLNDKSRDDDVFLLPTAKGNIGADAITLIARIPDRQLPDEARVELQNKGIKGVDTTIDLLDKLVVDHSQTDYGSDQAQAISVSSEPALVAEKSQNRSNNKSDVRSRVTSLAAISGSYPKMVSKDFVGGFAPYASAPITGWSLNFEGDNAVEVRQN